ncbi:alpha-1,4-L-rhamnosidase [Flammeovirga sp. OC4]|uniref:alpha-1,4-L-rhamnosidase n=1 Tax=Flammeovirga sp. OC4 TaxID=1382345 RepID=UPI0005C61D75|nr:alpha-1,4-L-rhamnosidase [Flammeovirga sp. OC4]
MNIKITYLLFLILSIAFKIQGQIVLEADFTDNAKAKEELHYPLKVFNRISPIHGFNLPIMTDAQLCIVRPLGGKYKKGNAALGLDTYLWDEEKKIFYTDFTLLKKQVDNVLSKGFGIHQMVLDNPSWAFQRDASGKLEGDTLKISTYGNAEPPRDFEMWAAYLKEVMMFLVTTYGEKEVLKIQFGIGREIGTEGHWKGTKEQFFDFYKVSIQAIHEVLPEAKVGTHFLWASSKKSWAIDFVKWSHTNGVYYDFLGVSYYPFYNRTKRTNFEEVYLNDFGAIKDIPEWNSKAVFEIHEFALIKTMNAKGNGYEKAEPKYQNSFLIGMMKMFYEHDMKNLFQWGKGNQYQPANQEILKLKGNTYYSNTKSGKPQYSKSYVDAIFLKEKSKNRYSIMAYNYSSNPTSNNSESVIYNSILNVPSGTKVQYRSAIYSESTNDMQWSDWRRTTTVGNDVDQSVVVLKGELPTFSFMKYEFKIKE